MYFQFLIEDKSGKVLVEKIMDKLCEVESNLFYECKYFHGIGGFTKKNTVKETKTGKLLNDLATYLRGFDKSLKFMPDGAAVFVVLDNDTRETEVFRNELEQVAISNNISIDHVFCIAVEEMEAWLLGDEAAIKSAYPEARLNYLKNYKQDSICGTWEILAEIVYEGGMKRFAEECPTFVEAGRLKSEWAEKIGQYMDLDNNHSPSFQFFIGEVRRRLSA
ncbi:DUF4276 family protein [Selenomonas ruminantium]|uniref:DUF4276 family protein n=1 Tax=Selenomonas ruminantium TaxID=971 RepID=UPI00047A1AB6|nr:DUF4276 family protein [Selenomonas ruminantium]